ncbi:MAG TPA: hypothetical protein VL481_01760 [Verrucomicrobiae bacterium]|nr:hypothetical protein [Verrucomicrobiae bacterium]
MKNTLTTSIKTALEDRLLAAMVIVLILLCIVFCIYVGISLRPSDLQVAVHYTAFGPTGFYREKWYYLANFIALGGLIAVIHTALIVKLHAQGRRQIAFLFGWMSLLLLVVAFFIARSVLRVAFL